MRVQGTLQKGRWLVGAGEEGIGGGAGCPRTTVRGGLPERSEDVAAADDNLKAEHERQRWYMIGSQENAAGNRTDGEAEIPAAE